MARKRMIDPSIWMDEGMAELSPRQQLLYIGLFSNADDEGRLKGSPAVIRMILPTVYAGCDLSEVETDLDAVLAAMQQLVRYEADGRPYLVFRNYRTWQYIQKPQPSVLPAPPDENPAPSETAPIADAGQSDTATVPVPDQHESATDQKKRKERKGTEEGQTAQAEPANERMMALRERATTTLVEFGVSEKHARDSLAVFPDAEMPRMALEAMKFVEHCRARSPSKRVKNPNLAWTNWLKLKLKFDERDRANAPPQRPLPAYLRPMPNVANGDVP